MQQNALYLLDVPKKGRGVFAGRSFSKKDIIEICPVIIVSAKDRKIIHTTSLHDYYFLWGKNQAAIALGYGSLYNHSSRPNVQFVLDYTDQCIIVECIKPIKTGEEILANYINGPSDEKIWFEEC